MSHTQTPFTLSSFSKAILHVDGDSFFVGCEIAQNPQLRGKPVVTGAERGIASAVSYEGKKLGIKRGMSISEIKKVCPSVIVLPSDYETYSLYSKRMYEIVRRWTPAVEEYSIDECFADLTGLRRVHHMSYPEIAERIKHELKVELGVTFSVGLAPTKVLAKVASKWNKPNGLTIIRGKNAHTYLKNLTTLDIWGIGPMTAAFLRKHNIITAFDFATAPEAWVRTNLSKPFQEVWDELRTKQIYNIDTERKTSYQSISKTKTFTPASKDPDYVFAQLSKNIENACIKARRYSLSANRVFIFLKTQEFRHRGIEIRLDTATNAPSEIARYAEANFWKIYRSEERYRSTGVVLSEFEESGRKQLDLFGSSRQSNALVSVFQSIDELDTRYGKHTVFLGSSFQAVKPRGLSDRGRAGERRRETFKGETRRRRVALATLGNVQ